MTCHECGRGHHDHAGARGTVKATVNQHSTRTHNLALSTGNTVLLQELVHMDALQGMMQVLEAPPNATGQMSALRAAPTHAACEVWARGLRQ